MSGKIVGAVDGFVPGAKYLGGALSFGATLLYPEPTPQELQEQLREIKAGKEGTSNEFVIQALEKAQLELEEKIANPVGEIKVEFAEVRADMKRIFSEVGESSKKMTLEMSKLRDLISRTFQIVVDNRFKVRRTLYLYLGRHIAVRSTVYVLRLHAIWGNYIQVELIVFILRTASRQLIQRTMCFYGLGLRISSSTPSSYKPALTKTSTLKG